MNLKVRHGAWAATAAALLLGLPIVGPLLQDRALGPYLRFPPETFAAEQPPLSWPAFAALALVTMLICLPFLWRGVSAALQAPRTRPARPFPWWGWAGLLVGAAAWIIAWTRFDWARPVQLHTFTPLWLAYIVVINALTLRRTGRCMLVNRPGLLGALFVCSAAFWWFFEYLNRFVQNWYYTGIEHFSAGEYVLFASISFSTVLPAVLGTCEWLRSFPLFAAFEGFTPDLRGPDPERRVRRIGLLLLAVSAAGLAGVGLRPDLLFPLLWIAPLFILAGLRALAGRAGLLDELLGGDWRRAAAAALAALICGGFWEMWNVHSLAKWIYAVPYVHAVQVFEMPLLGYAGYLPFGLECLVVGDLIAEALGLPHAFGARAPVSTANLESTTTRSPVTASPRAEDRNEPGRRPSMTGSPGARTA